MSDRSRPPGQGHNKQDLSGISADLAQLRTRVDRAEKLVQEHLAEKNQWNSEVRTWVGKKINILLTSLVAIKGELRWVDRYTMCVYGIIETPELETTSTRTIIVHKGAVSLMFLEKEDLAAAT